MANVMKQMFKKYQNKLDGLLKNMLKIAYSITRIKITTYTGCTLLNVTRYDMYNGLTT